VATVLGVLAGVAGLRALELGTSGAFASVRSAFQSEAGAAALTAVPAGDAAGLLPAEALGWLERTPGVRTALPVVRVEAEPDEALEAWQPSLLPGEVTGLLVLGVDHDRERAAGRFLEMGKSTDGVAWLVGDAWAQAHGIRSGGKLRLGTPSGPVEIRVEGTVATHGLGSANSGRVVIGPASEVRRLFSLGPTDTHEVALVLAPELDPDAMQARLARAAPRGVSIVRPGDRGKDVIQRMRSVTAATSLTSSFSLFLTAFLVYGLFATSASERRRDLALLRCAGATRLRAGWFLVVEAAVLAVPGALAGAGLGAWLARAVARGLSPLAGRALHVSGETVAGALRAAAVGIAVALVAASIPALRAARERPLDSLRARSQAAHRPSLRLTLVAALLLVLGGAALVADPPGLAPAARTYALALVLLVAAVALLPGAAVPVSRLAMRLLSAAGPGPSLGAAGPRWRPGRTAIAAGTVLACTAMAGGVAAVSLAWRAELDAWADRSLPWDVFVRSASGVGPRAVERLLQHPEVSHGTPVLVRRTEALAPDHRRLPIALAGLDPDAAARERTFVFAPGTTGDPAELTRALSEPDTALVTSVVAEQLSLHPGDEVTVSTPTGPRRLRIRAEVVDYTLNGFVLVVSDAWIHRSFHGARADLVALKLRPGVDVAAFTASLDPGLHAERRDALKARVRATVTSSLGALDGLLVLCAAIGLLAVASAVIQGSIERRGDLAILRSLGMARPSVTAMLCTEAALTSALGAVAGIGAGLLLGWVFVRASRTLGVPAPFVAPWCALGLCALASIGLAGLVGLIPAQRALRVPPAEALRNDG
jgi:putative ABC transport system permease protein